MKATKQHAACWLQFVVAGFAFAANPLFTDKWTADPAPLVDGYTLYLFTSHDYAPQGYGLAFLELSSKCQPVLKAGKRYVLEMRGAKGASTCYWRRSRDGDKRHAFALYGAGS